MKKLLFTVLATVILFGCIKDEWVLNNQTKIPNLDPSFAIPIMDTELNLSKMELALNDESFIYNDANQTYALVYSSEVIKYSSAQLKYFGDWNMNYSHGLSVTEANALGATPTGSSISFLDTQSHNIPTLNNEAIDSVTFSGGTIAFNFNSQIAHHHQITITIPGLTLDGIPFSEIVSFDYPGFTPFGTSTSFPLNGYKLDLTNGEITTNSVLIETNMNFTSTGNIVNTADQLDWTVVIDPTQYQTIWGYMGQHDPLTSEGTQIVNLFKNHIGGLMTFKNPSIDLTFTNSTGVPVDAQFTMIFAPENTTEQSISGGDLFNIPLIQAAATINEPAITSHAVNNQSTTPNLNVILDEGPLTLLYTNNTSINPQGQANNFLTDSGKVTCKADLILPFWGFASSFTLLDTLDLDLEKALVSGEGDVITLNDIEKATMRLIVDNGLPIDVGAQVYFADSLGNLLDSVFVGGAFETIFAAGYVDVSLPQSDINYGRVLSPTRKITDFVLTGSQIQELINLGSKKMIVKSIATIESLASSEYVRFFPEYKVSLKISAKIDTQLNLSE